MFNINPSIPNTRYLMVGVISFVCILTLAVLIFLAKETQTEAPVPASDTLTTENEIALQEQISPLIKAGDMSACNQVQNEMYRKVCINNIALQKAEETKDISYCQHLDDELISRDTCERQVMFQKSMEDENIAACAEATNESLKKECEEVFLFGLAQKKSDPKLCDQDADMAKADRCWNAYHIQSATAPSPEGERRPLDCSLLRGDDVKTDCTAIAPALESQDTRKLAEACQAKKSDVFNLVCMMTLRQGMPNTDRLIQAQ